MPNAVFGSYLGMHTGAKPGILGHTRVGARVSQSIYTKLTVGGFVSLSSPAMVGGGGGDGDGMYYFLYIPGIYIPRTC